MGSFLFMGQQEDPEFDTIEARGNVRIYDGTEPKKSLCTVCGTGHAAVYSYDCRAGHASHYCETESPDESKVLDADGFLKWDDCPECQSELSEQMAEAEKKAGPGCDCRRRLGRLGGCSRCER